MAAPDGAIRTGFESNHHWAAPAFDKPDPEQIRLRERNGYLDRVQQESPRGAHGKVEETRISRRTALEPALQHRPQSARSASGRASRRAATDGRLADRAQCPRRAPARPMAPSFCAKTCLQSPGLSKAILQTGMFVIDGTQIGDRILHDRVLFE